MREITLWVWKDADDAYKRVADYLIKKVFAVKEIGENNEDYIFYKAEVDESQFEVAVALEENDMIDALDY